MFEFFFDILADEKEYFDDEEKKALMFLQRGRAGLERAKIDFWYWCVKACQMELNYIKEELKSLQMEYYAITLRGGTFDAYGRKSFYTILPFIVKGEENKGYQDKIVSVRFERGIDTFRLSSGFLVVHKSKIVKPKIYEEEIVDGKKKRTFITIREIYTFSPDPAFESPEMEEQNG